jgi:two-component system nitrogen regulation sensor histidine kinase NtrY
MLICSIIAGFNAAILWQEYFSDSPNFTRMIDAIMAELLSLLVLAITLIILRLTYYFNFSSQTKTISRLRKRIILTFSLSVAIPTIMMTIFSTYFFNFGLQAWFDQKVTRLLDQSLLVGKSYINEHSLQLKETIIDVAAELNSMYYDLIYNPNLFAQVLNAQARARSFDEAIVFERNSKNILAQTMFSFSLSFLTIPPYLLDKADKGEIVRITHDKSKMRVLIKLNEYNQTYLVIGRIVEPRIIDYIDNTKGAVSNYQLLRENMNFTQVKFAMIFLLTSLLMLLSALIWARYFADKIVKPIKELVIAAERVKNGDLDTRVPLEGLKKDEIRILSSVFNRMVEQIDRQQKELIIAQRALAWSDVARRVAHEIKNPLTPIQLSAERLAHKFEHEVSDKAMFSKYIGNILRNSNDIKNIVSEFVDFARLPSPSFMACDIVLLVRELIDSRALIHDDISYKFSSNLDSCNIFCDISQMNRVITNLLLNSEESLKAVDYHKKISVEINHKDEVLHIMIQDNGNGFNPELLETAKSPYVTTKENGTGLGLSIVERIVSDHFGQLVIANNIEGGALITITLDLKMLSNYRESLE